LRRRAERAKDAGFSTSVRYGLRRGNRSGIVECAVALRTDVPAFRHASRTCCTVRCRITCPGTLSRRESPLATDWRQGESAGRVAAEFAYRRLALDNGIIVSDETPKPERPENINGPADCSNHQTGPPHSDLPAGASPVADFPPRGIARTRSGGDGLVQARQLGAGRPALELVI
jgi:hypothetical protein